MKLTPTIAASTCLLIFAGCMGESTHDKMMRIAKERSKIRAAEIEQDEPPQPPPRQPTNQPSLQKQPLQRSKSNRRQRPRKWSRKPIRACSQSRPRSNAIDAAKNDPTASPNGSSDEGNTSNPNGSEGTLATDVRLDQVELQESLLRIHGSASRVRR